MRNGKEQNNGIQGRKVEWWKIELLGNNLRNLAKQSPDCRMEYLDFLLYGLKETHSSVLSYIVIT